MMKTYSILSTFTGAGGLDLGFHGGFSFLNDYFPALPFKTDVAVEWSPFACGTLKHNTHYFSGIDVRNEDITKLDKKDLPQKNYDVLLGGFPCVTFSVVGKQLGLADDTNGQLYESFASYVEYFQPKVFLAENVKGILSSNKGEAIKIIKKRFEATGYNLTVQLVNFADYGVPQLRERVIFVGVRKDLGVTFNFPEPLFKECRRTAEEAFKNLLPLTPNQELMNIANRTKEMLERIPEGGNFEALRGTPYEVKGLMSNIYRKLDRNKPAYTVIASGGGGTWTYHYEEPRPLTNRERARLQSFPDDFVFHGNFTEIRRQLGNAVPPVGIYPIAKETARLLQKSEIQKPICYIAPAKRLIAV